MRFVSNLRRAVNREALVVNDYVTLGEFRKAKRTWLKACQDDLICSNNFKDMRRRLNIFEDETGILRSKGRINNANLQNVQ